MCPKANKVFAKRAGVWVTAHRRSKQGPAGCLLREAFGKVLRPETRPRHIGFSIAVGGLERTKDWRKGSWQLQGGLEEGAGWV